MCIICVKKQGIQMPSQQQLKSMFEHNPDGCGYMFNRMGRVHIRKGFFSLEQLQKSMEKDRISAKDNLVLHFRISTQAGINKEMTHPFPFTNNLERTKVLDTECKIGIAHNGIIRLTSNPLEKEYSDTAIFIVKYLTKLIRGYEDVTDQSIKDIIKELTNSKLALLTKDGTISTIGDFVEDNGLLFSNYSYRDYTSYYTNNAWNNKWSKYESKYNNHNYSLHNTKK